MTYSNIKHRTFEIIEKGKDTDIVSKIFDDVILSLIFVNIISMFVLTFPVSAKVETAINHFEIVAVMVFTVEYVLRVWTSEFLYPQVSKPKAAVKYIFSFMALIDLIAILPFYLPFITNIDLTILRALRFVRVFRLLKLNRYTTALSLVSSVIKDKSAELISSVFVVFILMLISSVLMYSVESPVQPEVFKNGMSGLWWAVATFTTVGYGDIYPITGIGKILSTIMAMLGIGLVAVPTGIISSGFVEQSQKKREEIDKQDTNLEIELDHLRKQIDLIESLINEKDKDE